MPGAVIDALAAGVPVLAYRWRYYDDMLQDGVTGFGCEPDVEGLAGLVRRLAGLDDSALMAMMRACVARAGCYNGGRGLWGDDADDRGRKGAGA